MMCPAQSVLHNHLIISMAGGGGLMTMYSSSDEFDASSLASSAVRFAFGYAMSDRFSFGGHYDRIGTVVHPGALERVRATTYMIEGTYRPFLGRHATVETTLAIGGAIMVLRQEDQMIPFESRSPAYNVSVRYLHLINETIGAFTSLDHAQAMDREVTYRGDAVHSDQGPLRVSWHAQRITAGMFVRF